MQFIPLGVRKLDSLFGNGIQRGVITQIYGPPASGKTNLCLQALLSTVRSGNKAAYIDTEGGFSFERLKQISGSEFDKVLKNTILIKPTNFEEQCEMIERFEPREDILLTVFDSAVSLYRLELEEDKAQEVNRLLSKQVSKLLESARKYNTAVLITNQVYSDFDTKAVKPVAGDILQYLSKIIVEVEKTGEKRTAIVRKHLFKEEGESAPFYINDFGISE